MIKKKKPCSFPKIFSITKKEAKEKLKRRKRNKHKTFGRKFA